MTAHRSLAALLAVALFSGCASLSKSERAFIAASALDTATTAHAIDQGLTERNPALTIAGDDAASVVLTSVVFTTAYVLALRKLGKKQPKLADALLWSGASLRGIAAAANASATNEVD